VWIAAVTLRYGYTVVRSVRSPFNYGRDTEWFIVWITVATAMMALSIAVKRPERIVLPILVTACFLILLLSGTFISGVIASAVLLLAHLWGRLILRWLGVLPDSAAITIPLGLVVPSLVGFALAALHVLTPVLIAVSLVVLFCVPLFVEKSWPPLQEKRFQATTEGRGLIRHKPFPEIFPLLLITPVILLNLIWAVAPEIQFDANNYHLAVSQSYLRSQGFVDLPYSFHSYFYHLVEMLFTIALGLHGAATAKFLSFGFSLVAAYAVYRLGSLVFNSDVGIWAAAFFYTTPVVSWLAGTAYIDNAVAMFLTATAIAFIRWCSSQEQTGWLYATALLAGATVATKVNGAFGVLVLSVFVFWRSRSKPATLAICALLALAVALPWFAMTYVWTGNPVFPMLNGIFQSPRWDLENRVMNASDFDTGTSPTALLRLPLRLVFDTNRFGEAAPKGSAGVVLLFAVPFSALFLKGRRGPAAVLFLVLVVHFLMWALSFQYARYYVHMLPIACILGVAIVFGAEHGSWSGKICKICLACALVLQFPAGSIQYWNIGERFPLALAFGRESRESFLRRALDDYGAVERLNSIVKPDDRILGVNVEDARFYLNAPLETLAEATRISSLNTAAPLSGEDLIRTLKQAGFTYLFVRRTALKDPPAWYPYLKSDFLSAFSTEVFSDANTVVYRLKP
jgi:hypothetical protein